MVQGGGGCPQPVLRGSPLGVPRDPDADGHVDAVFADTDGQRDRRTNMLGDFFQSLSAVVVDQEGELVLGDAREVISAHDRLEPVGDVGRDAIRCSVCERVGDSTEFVDAHRQQCGAGRRST